MYKKLENINIAQIKPLPPPNEILEKYPLKKKSAEQIFKYRSEIQEILEKKNRKFIVIVGPCSIHNKKEAIEYAEKLNELSKKVDTKIQLVMRAYFEKPRTTIGWKGLIYDPDLDGTCNIQKGIKHARELLVDIADMGLPIATEILDPVTAQYIADLITWAAIGARTTESQTHRQLASGLSMPVGFKNATNGSIQAAIDAVKSANHSHTFLGLLEDGRSGSFFTKGNKYAHIVLRGGSGKPNYTSEYIAYTNELMKRHKIDSGIIIDCSHANSGKKAANQSKVLNDIIRQKQNNDTTIVGIMIESNLKHGNQPINSINSLKHGISITDECIGWEETEKLIMQLYDQI